MKLEIELVPTPLWGESLHRLLSRAEWERVRKTALDRAAGHCEVCGAASPRLICHEQWDYEDEAGRRVLAGIQAICGLCNSVTHIGRVRKVAALGGLDLQEVTDHFMKVNGIDWSAADTAIHNAFESHRKRNERSWTTDFGPYSEAVSIRRRRFPNGGIPIRKYK